MALLGLPLWMILSFLFVFGAVIGSFLNVCIYRLPQHEQLWKALAGLSHPPSSCPYCQRRILLQDNIPILGWFFLGGRCRFCRHAFSFRYAAIELLNGLLFVLVYWFEIPSGYGEGLQASCLFNTLGPQGDWGSQWLSPPALLHWRYAFHMVLIEALLVASFIDFDLRIIPDGVTLPAMLVGVLGATAIGQIYIVPLWFQRQDLFHVLSVIDPSGVVAPPWLKHLLGTSWMGGPVVPAWIALHPHLHGLLVSLAGLIVGGGLVWGVRLIGQWVLRQEAMGFGDVVLMAMIGSFLGWQPVVMVFFLAPVCALIVVLLSWVFLPQREIPFGPYLSLASLIVILAWKPLWSAAEHLFGLGPLLPPLALLMALMLLISLLLVQGVKRLLGIELSPPEWIEEWTSADQLSYQASGTDDPQQGRWRTAQWPGAHAGSGAAYRQEWRRNSGHPAGVGWQQHWQRRNGR